MGMCLQPKMKEAFENIKGTFTTISTTRPIIHCEGPQLRCCLRKLIHQNDFCFKESSQFL